MWCVVRRASAPRRRNSFARSRFEEGPGQPGPFFAFEDRPCRADLEVVDAGERLGGAQARVQSARCAPASRSFCANAARWSSGRRRSPSSSATDSGARAARRSCRRRDPSTVLDVVDPAGFEQEQRRGSVRREALVGEELRIARGDDAADVTSNPACRWSGWIRYGCHGSCPNTTSGRLSRITRHTARAARDRSPARRRRSGGTRRRRRRAPRPPPAAPPRASRMSAPRSASSSQVPLEPSVQMHIVTWVPGRGPLGERGAATELDVVGVRADRERTARHGEVDRDAHGVGPRRAASARRSRSSRRSRGGEVGGEVDVESELGVVHDPDGQRPAPGFCGVAGGRIGSVREGERRRGRQRQDRRSVVAMVGHDHGDRRGAVGDDRIERAGEREVGVDDRVRAGARVRRPRPGPPRAAASSEPGSSTTSRSRVAGPRDDFDRARDDRRRGGRPAASTTPSAIDRASASRSGSDSTGASRALPDVNDRSGTTIPASSRDRLGIRCVCYRPWTRCIPPRRRCSTPGCGTDCAGPSRARRTSRPQGPTILASNHVSYLDPLTLAWVADRRRRRIRFLAKSELFRNPVLGALLRAAHQIPVYRGTADSSGALSAAVDALQQRRMRHGVPRRHDLRGLRADAGQVGHGAPRAGVGRSDRPGRSLGHAPAADEGPQAALRVAHCRRSPSSASRCVSARASGRATRRCGSWMPSPAAWRGRVRSTRNGPDRATTRGGGAVPRPSTHIGGRHDSDRSGRRGVVGNCGRRDRGGQRRHDAVGPPARARGADPRRAREPGVPARGCAARTRCTRPTPSKRRAPAPTCSCSASRRTACVRCWPRRGRSSAIAYRS